MVLKMARNDNVLNVLMLAAIAAVGAGYFVPRYLTPPLPVQNTAVLTPSPALAGTPQSVAPRNPVATAGVAQASPAAAPKTGAAQWLIAAPGRIEPTGGEIRMTAQAPGRIIEVLPTVNDKVLAGDLLIRIDDVDAEARVAAAEAEVSVRRSERNSEAATAPARERRVAEDANSSAERALTTARIEYDRQLRARKLQSAVPADLQKARDALSAARDRLDAARATLRRVATNEALPAQTRLEAAVAAARTDLTLADAALERTRLRAPRDATVLQVTATVGETASPSPDQILIVLGDLSALRVRTEIEERDVAKIKIGQIVVVRSDAYPGQNFAGKVASLAQALAPGRIALKGPRRGTEVDVLEAMIDITEVTPLLPGMRVDVFVKHDGP